MFVTVGSNGVLTHYMHTTHHTLADVTTVHLLLHQAVLQWEGLVRELAATRLQATWRGHKAVATVTKWQKARQLVAAEQREQQLLQARAAVAIQRVHRGATARTKARRKRTAAVKIQVNRERTIYLTTLLLSYMQLLSTWVQ
jgi:IQ calmodulin-binding motif